MIQTLKSWFYIVYEERLPVHFLRRAIFADKASAPCSGQQEWMLKKISMSSNSRGALLEKISIRRIIRR
jgi:hypothetical protein